MTRRRTSVGALIAAALTTVFTAMVLAATSLAAPARADVQPDELATDAAEEIADTDSPLYVAPDASGVLGAQESGVRTTLEESDAPIYAAVVPAMTTAEIRTFGTAVIDGVQRNGTYVIMTADGDLEASSNTLDDGAAEEIAGQAASNNQGDPAAALQEFVQLTNEATDNGGSLPNTTANTALLVVLAVLVLGGAGLYGFARQRRKKREAEELEQAKTAAEEDVVRLGEDVAQLDLDVRDTDLDPDARRDYTQALDSYDAAKAALSAATRPDELRNVTSALEEGRYAMACVRARLDGQPVPERRAPCFFNPQHGPSVTDINWAPVGGSTRMVPVCTADLQRLESGEDPDTREVLVNGQRRPYWEGGRAYGPWAGGYYGGYGVSDMFTGMLIGSMLFGGWGGGFGGMEGGMGDVGGGDFGGGGGFDFGGGDFGGGGFGDFGGGDF